MAYKFIGTIDTLKNIVKATGIQGEWRPSGNMYTFRSSEGGVLNWWSNGTVNFQGDPHAKMILERSLKKNLDTKPAKSVCDLDDADASEPFALPRHHVNSEAKHRSTLLLLRIKGILTASEYVVTRHNDSTYIVREPSGNTCCYLVHERAEVYKHN